MFASTRTRICVALLAAFGVALLVLTPILKVRDGPSVNTSQVTRPKKPNASHGDLTVTIEQLLPVVSLEVTNHVFDGVPVRMYRPSTNSSKKRVLPVVVYYHGGGWIIGSVDGSDSYTRRIAMNTGLLVISVEYRLAPKYPYPIPVDDSHKAALYIMKHALELDVDVSRVILMGDSAGGNLAAVVSQRMKSNDPPLLAQVIIYPVVQSLNFQLPSDITHHGEWLVPMFLTYFMGSVDNSLSDAMLHGSHVSDRVRHLYSKYVDYRKLPESFRKDYVAPQSMKMDPVAAKVLEPFITNPDINPLMNEGLKGLPHTMLLTVGIDPLRDEGVLYAIRLKEAGIPLQHLHYEDGRHGECPLGSDSGPASVTFRMNSDIFKFIHNRVLATLASP